MKMETFIKMSQERTGVRPKSPEIFEMGKILLLTTSGPDGEKPAGELLHELGLKLAEGWLNAYFGISWDDLPDVNSMWDVVDGVGKSTSFDSFKKEVWALAVERTNA